MIKSSILEDILNKVFQSNRVIDGFRLVWHNGEPLSLGMDFYRQALSIIRRVNANSKRFLNCIQTNGTLINNDWADFFLENDISPSVSIDGPQHIHDANRVMRSGSGTFESVMRGVRILRERGLGPVALCVVTSTTLNHGRELIRSYLDEGFTSLGLIIEEPWGGNPTTSFTQASWGTSGADLEERYKAFISDLYDEWMPNRDRLEIREFNDMFRAFQKIKLNKDAVVQMEDCIPCTVLSFDRHGGITTFSPQMIAGTLDNPGRFIVANIRDIPSLDDIPNLPAHQLIQMEVEKGVRKCREECGYFQLCGGGAPASKFYEHGTFDCTVTRECRYSKQLIGEILLGKLTSEHSKIEHRVPC